ncbi:hypothetical protein SAMN02910344_02353 [Ruminobacter amylophilus]|uniref:Virulence protein n=2 Tax=Ruminobacter amylophilus TaxID=867 RepID=A0A662ZKJ4_9GAMM|nr:virulence protein [Ruminobacter amylophilus]SFP81519.1 hypothetical protein SAMN02910344_02353 [Ruminobacter amylophilus]
MKIDFNLKGAERKELVKAISRITGIKAEYQGMPTTNFVIGDFTVTAEGALVYDDKIDAGELLNELAEAGFEGTADKSEGKELKVPEPNILTIEMPADKVNTENLQKLLDAKGALIRKALGIDNLAFEIQEDRVSFPWFIDPAPDYALAYTQFIAAICKMSTEQKRVTAKVREINNEKYAFRCFLLRLGFIGEEFKQSRKILLSNLDGSSAFKTVKEEPKEVHDEVSE